MGIFERFRFVRDVASGPTMSGRRSGRSFSTDLTPEAQAIFGIGDSASWTSPVGKIDRKSALQVPAVKRSRDLICGTVGALPINYIDEKNVVQESELLRQPERDIPRSVTMTRTMEDVLLDGMAVWRVVERDEDGWPVKVRRLESGTWDVQQDAHVYVRADGTNQGTAWEYVPDADVIRFYSPNGALLEEGARAIRTCLKLDAAAARYADDPMAQGYFRSTENSDPLVDEQGEDESDEDYAAREGNAITALVTNWRAARQTGATGYVPAGIEYVPLEWDPAQLQLAEGRQHAVLEIARCAGVDPEDLGVSTTSRTYVNGTQKREELVDYTLNPYAVAVQDRLSMGDVTPEGSRARFDYGGFAQADPATRMAIYAQAIELGLYPVQEAQRREEVPITSTPPAGQAPVLRSVPNQEATLQTAAGAGHTFDAAAATFGFDSPEAHLGFQVDEEKRTIYGLAVPYGVQSGAKNGRRYTFSRGSLVIPADPTRVKLLLQHDRATAIGKAVEFTDSPEGLWAKFKVARGADGDRALALAADGVWDGLSIGLRTEAKFDRNGNAISAPLAEISLVPDPSFSDARVTSVTASADSGVMTMPNETEDKGTGGTVVAPPAFDAAAFSASVTKAIGDGFATLTPKKGPAVISPAGGATFQVAEPHPYRFEGEPGEFDFSADLLAAGRDRSPAAQERLDKFMELQFATATTDVNEANPVVYRPDMYVDNLSYETPIWNAINKGALSSITPFSYAAWASSSNVVADHVEGTEPTVGSFVLTGDTVTPTALSGKFEINREVWDQVGNPAISALIWAEIKRSYYEGLETASVTYLDSLSPTGITITAGAEDDTLEGELTAALASLNYIRGGYRMRDFFVQVDLFKKLIAAVDDTGRKLFPVVGPSNASGSVAPYFGSVDIGGLIGKPAWALAATGSTPASSYLLNRDDVSGWATPPRRLDFDYQVKSLFVGVWGYKAFKATRLAGVREVIYDPVA